MRFTRILSSVLSCVMLLGAFSALFVSCNTGKEPETTTTTSTTETQTPDLPQNVPVSDEGLMLWYDFKDGLANDASGNNQNGKVQGICLGMQLMCRHSEEGDADCLGIFDIDVKKFQPMRHEDKVPHMGWNTLTDTRSDLFKGFDKDEFVYFVHSFYVPLNEFTAATTDYILPYSSALHKDNFYATQFHPEKSGKVGERILRNFIEL